jgi:hypothetical protein
MQKKTELAYLNRSKWLNHRPGTKKKAASLVEAAVKLLHI